MSIKISLLQPDNHSTPQITLHQGKAATTTELMAAARQTLAFIVWVFRQL